MQKSQRTNVMGLALASFLLAASPSVLAQQPGAGSQMPNQQQPTNPGQSGYGGNADTASPPMATGAANMQAYGDQEFLRKTMEADLTQIQLGQMAVEKSSSEDVKEFGQKMADIHQQLTNQLKPIAQKLGVNEPKNPPKKEREEIAKMQSLSGADFDSAFIRAMMHNQKDSLKGFHDEAANAHDPNVQQVAKMDEPVLNQHFQILQKIAESHNVTEESSK